MVTRAKGWAGASHWRYRAVPQVPMLGACWMPGLEGWRERVPEAGRALWWLAVPSTLQSQLALQTAESVRTADVLPCLPTATLLVCAARR